MLRPRTSPENIALLLTLLEAGTSTTDASAQLGIQWFTANWWARRWRRGEPWAESIEPFECQACGEPGLGNRGRTVHPSCEPARAAAYQRRARAEHRPGSLSTPYVSAYRAANPHATAAAKLTDRARARARNAELDPERRAELVEKVHTYDREAFERTAALAGSSGDHYSDADDLVLLDRARDRAEDVAIDLGRSVWSIRSRRSKLLRARPEMRQLLNRTVRRGEHWIWPDAASEAHAREGLWMHTYPRRALPRTTCSQSACVRPSHQEKGNA